MKRFFNIFKDSAMELTGKGKITCIVMTALFIALSMSIEAFTIEIPFAKINFAYIAIAAIGMLYGPTIGFFAGGICDILGYMVHPDGAFLPAYTLIAMVQGLIYGIVVYRRWGNINITVKNGKGKRLTEFAVRIVAARLLDVVIVNLFLNTAANLHYGFIPSQAYSAAIIARLAKNALQLCADIPILLVILPVIMGAYMKVFGKRQAAA